MPTADQLAGLAAGRAARAAYEKAESALVDALMRVANARAALDDAVARESEEDVKQATQALEAVEARRDNAAEARVKAEKAIASARAKALGTNAGFDLLSGPHPLLLLPVRLETRFAWVDGAGGRTFADTGGDRMLLVRIYPDDIHDDAHEPDLAPAELALLKQLQVQLAAASDQKHLNEAWANVIRHVGPTRAGWLGELLARGKWGRRPGFFSRPSVARLLPDCWVAIAELDDGSTRREVSRPVREPLETGPSPDGIDWMIDFDAALDAGMALVFGNLPAALEEIRKLVVVGARGTLDPDETATELERLLDAQHYTRGLAFLAPGTPTNSLPGAPAGYTSRPGLDEVLPIERRRFAIGLHPRPLCQPRDGSGGSSLARALGIPVDVFGYVGGADAVDQLDELVLRNLLVTATRRHLARLLPGILEVGPLAEVLGFGVTFVSAAGHFPALRVGAQPYGVLPVLLRDDARLPPDSLSARLLPVLDRLRGVWSQAAAGTYWIGAPGPNPGETLVRILQQDAGASRIAFRPLLGPQLGNAVASGLRGRTPVARQRVAAAQAIEALGAADPLGSPLLEALHLAFAVPLTVPLVEPAGAAPASPQRAANYLKLIASLQPDLLLAHDYGGAERPRTLLFAIARLAMLERADEAAREALVMSGADPALWDDEDVPSMYRDFLATPQRRLDTADPAEPGETLAFHLSELGDRRETLRDVREALRALADRPPDLLEELLRATLGLFSQRLDSWYTALAFERLDRELREDPASRTGLNAGAYGIVESIRLSPRQPAGGKKNLFTNPTNGGYVHAPSVNHGATAAVLRSVHLAHAAAGHGAAFSVDLSSERVRRGLELFEGIREGQPLAALLGYRIERTLAAEGLQRFIAPWRSAAPLVSNALNPSTQPAEVVGATNVVDGLTLLADAGYDGEQDPTAGALWVTHPSLRSPPDEDALDRVLMSARDALDAAADLAVAESVYQAVQGNPARAGATVDGLSGAPVPPPEIGVVRTPHTGVGVTHRLVVLLGDPPPGKSDWGSTARAEAEPRLEAWARATLPLPEHIRIRARFLDAEGAEVATADESLASLHTAAKPTAHDPEDLRLSALDVVLLADPHETPHRSGLELRLAALLELVRPNAAREATLELVLERHKNWDEQAFGLVETLEIARQLRDVISRSRALAPGDLAPLSGSPPVTAIASELRGRATQATSALNTAIADLGPLQASRDTGLIRQKLFAADLLGVAGAAPGTVRDTPGASPDAARQRERELHDLQGQVAATLNELNQRKVAVDALPAADAEGRLRGVFGETFTALATLEAVAGVVLPFSAAALPAGATEPGARAWLNRAARVRETTGALDRVLAYTDAVVEVEARVRPTIQVGQLGGASGERWVALPPNTGETVPGGRVSLLTVTPGGVLPRGNVAGLMVDEWVEVVPSAEQTTSVTFHCEAPTATAPQVWLLGIPPSGHETWSEPDAFQIVEEALQLAQIRLVDMDDVPGLGQLLPTFVTAENPAGDAIGLDIETLTEAP